MCPSCQLFLYPVECRSLDSLFASMNVSLGISSGPRLFFPFLASLLLLLWILVFQLVTHILRPEQSFAVTISSCNFSRPISEQFYVVAAVTGQTGQTSRIHCLSEFLAS